MYAEYLVLGALVTDNGGERQKLKDLIDFGKARIGLSDVLLEALGAFLTEA